MRSVSTHARAAAAAAAVAARLKPEGGTQQGVVAELVEPDAHRLPFEELRAADGDVLHVEATAQAW